MHRHLLSAALLLLLGSSNVFGQQWALDMFSETNHNFGTVLKGAKTEYRFQFHNPYNETVHVVGVRSSCGCTTPTVTNNTVKTFQKSEIVATLNTGSFTGHRAATLTVTIDQPFSAEVQLTVWGDIRGDIAVNPGLVDLGTVDQGQGAERRVTVTRYGRSDWQINDVRSVNTNFEVEVSDPVRAGSQVSYDLTVRLKKEAPPGYIHDQLILVTNDSQNSQFAIDVEGSVNAELNVSPQTLTLGTVEAGHTVTKPLVISSSHKLFRVAEVHCDDSAFRFKVSSDKPSKVQIINVTFTAPNKPGKLAQKLRIITDAGQGLTLEVPVQATVKASAAVAGSTSPKGNAPKAESLKPDSSKTDPLPTDFEKSDAVSNPSAPEVTPTSRLKFNAPTSGATKLDPAPANSNGSPNPIAVPPNPIRPKSTAKDAADGTAAAK